MISDIGKVLLSGGTFINASNINTAKRLGRKSKIAYVLEIFDQVSKEGFGMRDANNNFLFRDDIIIFVTQSENAKEFLINQGLSVSVFLSGLLKTPVPAKIRKRNLDNKENDEDAYSKENFNLENQSGDTTHQSTSTNNVLREIDNN